MDLTISIVNYNTREMLDLCLSKIISQRSPITFEVIVIDNSSSDGSVEMVKKKYPQVFLVENNTNRYFSAAHNQAFKHSTGRYFLIMNSDILITETTLPEMINFMDRYPDAGAASCIQKDQSSELWMTCWNFPTVMGVLATHWIGVHLFPNSKIRKKAAMTDWDRLSTRSVDVVEDAFMFVRRESFEKLGGYDESLLLYYTEQDICLRLKHAGWKIYHNSATWVTHYREFTSNKQSSCEIWRLRRRDMYVYFKKHHGMIAASFLYLFYFLDSLIRVPAKYIGKKIK